MSTSIALSQKDIERFWNKVKIGNFEDCWIWTASKDSDGYGTFRIGLKTFLAHRISWTMQFGDIPPKIHVCHKCDNPSCVNYNHFFLGNDQDNMNDMVKKGRSTFGRFRGKENGNSKLTEEDVLEIRNLLEKNVSLNNIAKRFSIGKRTVLDIKFRKTWYWLK